MKLRLYIIILSLVLITAFTYGTDYTISSPSIKTTQKMIENNILCVNISLISIDYIDSLVVNRIISGKERSQKFIFNPQTKRIFVKCYYNIQKIKNKSLEYIIYKSGKEYRYTSSL